MRPFAGLLLAVTLAVVRATAIASPVLGTPPDLGKTLVLRLFGEISDAASFSTSGVSLAFESPLREAAFVVSVDRAPSSCCAAVRMVAQRRIAIPAISYVAPQRSYFTAPARSRATASQRAGASVAALGLGVASPYGADLTTFFQPDASASSFAFGRATAAPNSGVPAFVTQSALGEGGTAPALDQNVQLPLALRLGNLHVLAGFDAGFATTPSAGIDNTLPVFVPSYANVSRSSLSANVAVPLAPRLLVGVGYNTERLVTGYGMPAGLDGLDARNDTYSGNLTFLFPRLSSALSLSAQQYRYQDNLLPAEFTQLRENLNLTVKF